jgi:hypothetical protein
MVTSEGKAEDVKDIWDNACTVAVSGVVTLAARKATSAVAVASACNCRKLLLVQGFVFEVEIGHLRHPIILRRAVPRGRADSETEKSLIGWVMQINSKLGYWQTCIRPLKVKTAQHLKAAYGLWFSLI